MLYDGVCHTSNNNHILVWGWVIPATGVVVVVGTTGDGVVVVVIGTTGGDVVVVVVGTTGVVVVVVVVTGGCVDVVVGGLVVVVGTVGAGVDVVGTRQTYNINVYWHTNKMIINLGHYGWSIRLHNDSNIHNSYIKCI